MEDEYIRPPGTYYDILVHPSDANIKIEVSIIQDHRFAFFYWVKWVNTAGKNKNGEVSVPPALITIDWHQDLVVPRGLKCDQLNELDLTDYKSIAYFCWDKLNPLNESHILSAAYLGIIGDIYVVCKQEDNSSEEYEDHNGNIHRINCYKNISDLTNDLKERNIENVLFDVDLDYFTESPDTCGGCKNLTLVPDEEIQNILNPSNDLMQWVFRRMVGMTIATEPEFCGGITNSNHILNVVHDTLFFPPLLGHGAGWKHLSCR